MLLQFDPMGTMAVMKLLSTFARLLAVFFGSGVSLSCLPVIAADDLEIVDTPPVAGLRAEATATNVTLSWPSDSRESFVVLWRSNATYRAQWIVLTNQMPAGLNNRTIFLDTAGLTRIQGDAARTNLIGLYVVYVIPDFWFDMEGITLNGGPQNPGEDFLSFYYGIGGTGFPRPGVGLMVDGEEAGWGPIQVERVNFGTVKKPRWTYAAGFWFRHDIVPNGEHVLQLRSMLSLNNFVGEWSQDIFLTNKSVRVRVTNEISFVGEPPFVGKSNLTIVAQSVEPRVNWQIEVYDDSSHRLIEKKDRTTTGNIQWVWDLRDARGDLHDDPARDFRFWPKITVWPINSLPKGAQLLMQRQNPHSWWEKKLGKHFVQPLPSPETYRELTIQEDNSLERQVTPRPLDLCSNISLSRLK
jgi:hypothetical protein